MHKCIVHVYLIVELYDACGHVYLDSLFMLAVFVNVRMCCNEYATSDGQSKRPENNLSLLLSVTYMSSKTTAASINILQRLSLYNILDLGGHGCIALFVVHARLSSLVCYSDKRRRRYGDMKQQRRDTIFAWSMAILRF